jgi:hypothetical protein
METQLNPQNVKLQKEIEEIRKEIKTDNFSMAIRELVQVYRDGDLELFPSYQRLFRWEDDQKTRFIESILMGIPTPPIFIAQKKGSKWTIVDGLQRVSTILQLMGYLEVKNTEGENITKPPLKFTYTEKLPSIEGLEWSTLNEDAQRIIKMAKLDLKIILVEDNIQAQYELFKRLNTGAVSLEPQEIRNCLIIMLDEDFYKKIDALKNYPSFKNCLNLTEAKNEIEFPMELILRYFIAKHNSIDFGKYHLSNDLLSDFLDKETSNLISDSTFNIDNEIAIFKRLFDLLDEILGEDSFRKFNKSKGVFEGAFSQSSFEAITSGLADNILLFEGDYKNNLKAKIEKMYDEAGFIENSIRGKKALSRIQGMIKFSCEYFKI